MNASVSIIMLIGEVVHEEKIENGATREHGRL